jgi:acetylornithine/N-succinyldiaminopimelate aminotransferase
MLGIDLSIDGAPFVQEALKQGLLINCTHEHILRLLPPFIIRQKDVGEFLRKFESVLTQAKKSAAKTPAGPANVENEAQLAAVAR